MWKKAIVSFFKWAFKSGVLEAAAEAAIKAKLNKPKPKDESKESDQ